MRPRRAGDARGEYRLAPDRRGGRLRVLLGFAHGIRTGTQGAARTGHARARGLDQPSLAFHLGEDAPHHRSGDLALLPRQQDDQLVFAQRAGCAPPWCLCRQHRKHSSRQYRSQTADIRGPHRNRTSQTLLKAQDGAASPIIPAKKTTVERYRPSTV